MGFAPGQPPQEAGRQRRRCLLRAAARRRTPGQEAATNKQEAARLRKRRGRAPGWIARRTRDEAVTAEGRSVPHRLIYRGLRRVATASLWKKTNCRDIAGILLLHQIKYTQQSCKTYWQPWSGGGEAGGGSAATAGKQAGRGTGPGQIGERGQAQAGWGAGRGQEMERGRGGKSQGGLAKVDA